jgi:hypothetical protein
MTGMINNAVFDATQKPANSGAAAHSTAADVVSLQKRTEFHSAETIAKRP